MDKNDLNLALRIRADMRSAQRQLDQLTHGLDDTDKSARRAGRGFRGMSDAAGQLRTVLASVGTALVLREIVRAADAYTNLRSQLRLVTDSQKELNNTFRDAYQLAQDTRQGLDPTINLYARLARATEELDLNQQQLLSVTRAINQSFIVSGASAQEAASSTLQLSQGIASGTLRGEELNSVLENSPRLARAIAEGLGVTIGQLRELGQEGRLTGKAVTQALLSTADDINREFKTMPRTVGQALQQLRNDLTLTFGQTDTSGFVDAIDDLRELVTDPGFQEGMATLGASVATLTRWLGEATAETVSFTKWLSEELASKVSGIAADDIPRLEQKMAALQKQLDPDTPFLELDAGLVFTSDEEIKRRIAETKAKLQRAYDLQDMGQPLPGEPDSANQQGASDESSQLLDEDGQDEDAAQKRLKRQREFVEQLEREADLIGKNEAATRAYEIAQKDLSGELLKRARAANAAITAQEKLNQAEEDAQALAEIETRLLSLQGDTAQARGQEVEQEYAELLERLKARSDDAGVAMVRSLIDREKLEARFSEFQDKLKAIQDQASSQRDVLSARFESGEISQPQYREGLATIDDTAVTQLEQMRDAAKEYAAAMGDPTILQNFDALVLGYQKVNDASRKFLADGQQINEMLASGLTDSLMSVADGTKSAGEAFRQFAADFLRQIAQMILKQIIFNAVSGGSDGGGGIGGAIAGAINSGFASGGWTGPGGKYQPAGIVHAGEYVQPQEVMREPGALQFMEEFRREGMRSLGRFQGYAEGGLVGAAPSISDSPAEKVAAAAADRPMQNDVHLYAVQSEEEIAGKAWGREGQQHFEVYLQQNGARVRQLIEG